LEDDIKLAIILNGLPERYRYLVVSLETQKKIDFDELTARLLEEELKVDTAAGKIAFSASKIEGECHYCGQKGHWKKDCQEISWIRDDKMGVHGKDGWATRPKYSM